MPDHIISSNQTLFGNRFNNLININKTKKCKSNCISEIRKSQLKNLKELGHNSLIINKLSLSSMVSSIKKYFVILCKLHPM